MILLDPMAKPLIAHRGASGTFPENTMLAFEQGLRAGADAIELDVRLSSDGIPMVIHDPVLDRTTNGSGPIGNYTAAQLHGFDAGAGEPIPSLDSVLLEFPQVPLIVELKEGQVAGPVMELLVRREATGRVIVGSFEPNALRPFDGDRFHRAASRRETMCFWIGSRLSFAPRGGSYHAFTVPEWHGKVRVISRSFTRWAARRSRPVHVWTINDRADAERLRATGVQGIITDFPERMQDLQ